MALKGKGCQRVCPAAVKSSGGNRPTIARPAVLPSEQLRLRDAPPGVARVTGLRSRSASAFLVSAFIALPGAPEALLGGPAPRHPPQTLGARRQSPRAHARHPCAWALGHLCVRLCRARLVRARGGVFVFGIVPSAVKVKWGKEKLELELDPTEDPDTFRAQLFAMTQVPPDRQKLMFKGKTVGETWEGFTLKAKMAFLLMGTANEVLAAPMDAVVFQEDLSAAQMLQAVRPARLQRLGHPRSPPPYFPNTQRAREPLVLARSAPALPALPGPAKREDGGAAGGGRRAAPQTALPVFPMCLKLLSSAGVLCLAEQTAARHREPGQHMLLELGRPVPRNCPRTEGQPRRVRRQISLPSCAPSLPPAATAPWHRKQAARQTYSRAPPPRAGRPRGAPMLGGSATRVAWPRTSSCFT